MQPDGQNDNNGSLGLPVHKAKTIQPLNAPRADEDTENLAVNLIRQKLQTIFEQEPSSKEELAEIKAAGKPRSKHQQFMYGLSTSGKSLAEIQTAWHNYYVELPDHEKHQVWQEFYANHGHKAPHTTPVHHQAVSIADVPRPSAPPKYRTASSEKRTAADIKKHLLSKVSSHAMPKSAHHKSLLFGLSMGGLMMLFMLFGFFNERFIAPFITPSRTVSSTPIIVDSTAAVGPEPKVIIPKINVEIPVVYDEKSIDEQAVQRALEEGVIHYAITSKPGELGNAAIFGHSSNNILNRGKYKFAFVLLNRMEIGDTFMLHYEGKRYIYKVFDKKVVPPTDLSVLDKTSKPATVSLITCDPPGTSINRLVVVGEQISPDPAANVASSVDQTASVEPRILPANAPSLWQRFTNWLTS